MRTALRHRQSGVGFPSSARRKPERPPSLFQWAGLPHHHVEPAFDPAQATKWALGVWRSSIDARFATLTERWLGTVRRELESTDRIDQLSHITGAELDSGGSIHQLSRTLPDCISGDVLRFNPRLSFAAAAANAELPPERVPGLVWLLTDVVTAEPVGILRYFLSADGELIGKRTLGRVYRTVIRLSPDEDVEQGLFVAPTVEIGIRALSTGLAPVWAVTNADALAAFPTLPGVGLTVIEDGC